VLTRTWIGFRISRDSQPTSFDLGDCARIPTIPLYWFEMGFVAQVG